MTYHLSKDADKDLVEILEFGLQNFGDKAAEAYYFSLVNLFEDIEQMPEAHRLRTDIEPPVRIVPHVSHMVVYEIDNQGDVIILRIRHSRENWNSGD